VTILANDVIINAIFFAIKCVVRRDLRVFVAKCSRLYVICS